MIYARGDRVRDIRTGKIGSVVTARTEMVKVMEIVEVVEIKWDDRGVSCYEGDGPCLAIPDVEILGTNARCN